MDTAIKIVVYAIVVLTALSIWVGFINPQYAINPMTFALTMLKTVVCGLLNLIANLALSVIIAAINAVLSLFGVSIPNMGPVTICQP